MSRSHHQHCSASSSRSSVKHDRLEFKKVTSARDLHKVANRAALAAVRELLA